MSEFEKVQCTCSHGYTCRAMRDPNCCAHNCDYNDAVDALNKVTAERDAALAQNAECGRAGFIAGYSQAQSDPLTADDTEIELYADEYAAKQQEGEQ